MDKNISLTGLYEQNFLKTRSYRQELLKREPQEQDSSRKGVLCTKMSEDKVLWTNTSKMKGLWSKNYSRKRSYGQKLISTFSAILKRASTIESTKTGSVYEKQTIFEIPIPSNSSDRANKSTNTLATQSRPKISQTNH